MDAGYMAVPGIKRYTGAEKARGIIKMVCDHYGLTIDDISKIDKTRRISYPRNIIFYLIKYNTCAPLEEVGKMVGGRHWATVIAAYKKVSVDIKKHWRISRDVEYFENKL